MRSFHPVSAVVGGGLVIVGLTVGLLANPLLSQAPAPSGNRMVCRGTATSYIVGDFAPINIGPQAIRVSSFNESDQTAASLIDNNPQTFWHVHFPKSEAASFIAFDWDTPQSVSIIKVLPRAGHIDQMWEFGAYWEGSDDGHSWRRITTLDVDRTRQKDGQWISFAVANSPTFRHFRLYITDPNFLSLAEIRLFRRKGRSEDGNEEVSFGPDVL